MSVKNILPLIFTVVFFGCNNTNNRTVKVKDNVEQESHQHEDDNHKEHGGGLALNNGIKWESDESTSKHAAKLIDETNAFNAKPHANVNAYHAFAGDLQNELNSLISDCKIKGPDHDALHLWLEPVLKDVDDLKKTQAASDAKELTEKLTEKIQMFDKYFK